MLFSVIFEARIHTATPISAAKKSTPTTVMMIIATVPIVCDVTRKSLAEVSFLMFEESPVLLTIKPFLLLSMDSSRVISTVLQIQTQWELFVAKIVS